MVPLFMAFQCNDEIETIEENLNETGLLGRWEITDEVVNGIDDMLPKCCRFFQFDPDDNKQDLTGLFTFIDFTGDYSGIFTVDQTKQQIIFQREGREPVVYDFTMNSSQDYLTFSFIEEENLNYVQGWAKRN